MPAAKPENEFPAQRPESAESKLRRRNVYASETLGLVLIALVLLVLTLVRYWQNIHWSWR